MKLTRPQYGEVIPLTASEVLGMLLREENSVEDTEDFDDLLAALDDEPEVK